MKFRLLLIALAFSGVMLFADPYSQFTAVTDFGASIKSLVQAPETMNGNILYLLEGTISSINLIDPDPDHFYAEAQFFSSEWIDRKELKSYSIWLVFGKNMFAERIPQRPGQETTGAAIASNTKGIALAQYLDTIKLPDGQTAYVFNVHEYRSLDR